MKNGWECKKVSEIATHSLGKMLDKAKNKGEPRPYLRNLNVRWFEFDLSDLLEMRFLPEEEVRYAAVRGDVLVCEGGYPGRAAMWDRDEPIFFQKALHRVRFHEPERAKWFVYLLLAKDLDGTLRKHFNGAGIQHFTGEALAQFEVPLPPLAEQQRIVGILDEAFAGIATARANATSSLRSAAHIFEVELARRFDSLASEHPVVEIGGVCKTSSGGTPLRSRAQFFEGGTIPWVLSGEVAQGDITSASKFITNEGLRNSSAKIFPVGTVVVAMYGATAGQVGVLRIDAATNQAVCGVFVGETFLSEFLYFFFRARQSELIGKAVGNAQPNVSQAKIREMTVPLVPLDQQKRVVSELEMLLAQTSRLGGIYQRKLAALDELKRSLLHRAFSGQL